MKLRDYVPPVRAAAESDTSTIAMVAVYPHPEQAEALAVEGGLEPDDLHCTLVFLGDVADLDVDEITAAVARAVDVSQLEGTVGGVGRFAESPDGVPVIALPDVQGLTALRERVVEELTKVGVESPSEHGFLPHMTLTYMAADEEIDLEVAEEKLGLELTFDAVTVKVGDDDRYDYPLAESFMAKLTAAMVSGIDRPGKVSAIVHGPIFTREELRAAGMWAIATPDELTAATQRVHDGLDELIGPLASAYESVLRAAGRRIARELTEQATALSADARFLSPDEDEVMNADKLAGEIADDAAEATRQAAADVAASLESEGISYDVGGVFTDEMLEAVGERTAFAADQELRAIYRDVITAAGAEGWSISHTADEIISKVDGVASYRATAMARTDLIGLANAASVHAAQLTAGDQVIYKNWLATMDERTRPSHLEAHGQSVLVHESFQVGGVALGYPGDPFGPAEEVINCRCTITYGDAPGSPVVHADSASSIVSEPTPPPEPVVDPLAGIGPSDDLIAEIEDFWSGSGLAPEDNLLVYRQAVERHLAEQLAEGSVDVRIRTPADVALSVAEGGRILSQFEAGTSGGAFAPELRATAELDLFGYARELPHNERPVYGYVGHVTHEARSVRNYGDVMWVLKNDVRERTTWTQSDSLGLDYAPSPINRPSALSTNPTTFQQAGKNIDPLRDPLDRWETVYFEAQIHGGVGLADVERVVVYWDQTADAVRNELLRGYAEQTATDLRTLLGSRPIAVEVKPYPPYASGTRVAVGSAGVGLAQNDVGLGGDGLEVEVSGGLVPVPASDDAERRQGIADEAGALVEHAHLGLAQPVLATAREQHEGVVAALGDDLHATDDTPSVGRSQPSEGLPSHPPNEEEPMSTTISDRARVAITADGDGEVTITPIGWDAVLCVEGDITEDGRLLERGSIGWRDLPLTLMGMLETSWGHEGAKVAGRIDSINRIVDELASAGEFTSDFGVNELAPLVADRTVRGVSIDLAVLDYEYRDRDTGEVLTEGDLWEYWLEGRENDIVFTVLDGTIVGATVCPMPAIANAEIGLAASAGLGPEARQLLAAALDGRHELLSDVPIIKVFTPFDRPAREGLFAAAAAVELADPMRAAFEVTEFPGNTPFTVGEPDETGWRRVFGHLATWDTCHVGIPGVCTTAPRSSTDPAYALFHQHQYPVAEGGMVDVGVMMLGTGHASLGASRMEATRHYDKPDMIGAYVRAYDGEYGIWVSGVARDTLTPSGLRELRTNPPSGDWRQYNGRLELIAACAVAVPGFPVVASATANIVAAGGSIEIDALIASAGEIIPSAEVKAAMVAAGCACEDAPVSDEGIDDLADLGG